jgi:hypothetical protein
MTVGPVGGALEGEPTGASVDDASKVEFTQLNADLSVVGPSRVIASLGDATLVEGDDGRRRAIFPITLSRPSDEPVLLAYATSAGSATPGRDYRETTGFVTFQPGETRVTIGIRTFGDRFDEADESFTVTLQAVSGAQLGRAAGQGRQTGPHHTGNGPEGLSNDRGAEDSSVHGCKGNDSHDCGNQSRHQRNNQSDPRAVDRATQHVAAKAINSKRVFDRGPCWQPSFVERI